MTADNQTACGGLQTASCTAAITSRMGWALWMLLHNNGCHVGVIVFHNSRMVIMRGMLSMLCVAVGNIRMLCCCYILTTSVSVHWRERFTDVDIGSYIADVMSESADLYFEVL